MEELQRDDCACLVKPDFSLFIEELNDGWRKLLWTRIGLNNSLLAHKCMDVSSVRGKEGENKRKKVQAWTGIAAIAKT